MYTNPTGDTQLYDIDYNALTHTLTGQPRLYMVALHPPFHLHNPVGLHGISYTTESPVRCYAFDDVVDARVFSGHATPKNHIGILNADGTIGFYS